VEGEVRPVDDRSLLSPEVLDRIVAATLAELESRRKGKERDRDETTLWQSVRAGGKG